MRGMGPGPRSSFASIHSATSLACVTQGFATIPPRGPIVVVGEPGEVCEGGATLILSLGYEKCNCVLLRCQLLLRTERLPCS